VQHDAFAKVLPCVGHCGQHCLVLGVTQCFGGRQLLSAVQHGCCDAHANVGDMAMCVQQATDAHRSHSHLRDREKKYSHM
jgi:hypothetical protein